MNLKSCFVLCLLSGITILFSPGCSKNDSVTQLPPINGANNKITGYSGKDFLTANSFNSLKIEIQYMQGFQPDAVSVNNITSFLSSLINKPGGISVTQQQIPSGGKASYSINDIAVVEQNNRSYFNSGSQLAVYVLIADGNYSDPNVLGVAYRNTSLCLFGKKYLIIPAE